MQQSEIDIRRDMLNQVIKSTIKDIKIAQQDSKDAYTQDSVDYYSARASALVDQKIKLEMWRKKLKYTNEQGAEIKG